MNTMDIDISKPRKEFDEFLKLIGNNRIVFSGAFGVGKTYFLKKFFENNSNYMDLHLYPINYSVSSNSDIFELIKYDILYELLKKKPTLEKLELSFLDKLTFLDVKDTPKLLTPFIELIPKIGKKISVVIDVIMNLGQVLSKKTKGIEFNEGQLIKEFGEKIETTSGNIYENDFYTQLIIKLISHLKEDRKKQIVLIIDDLDRIDPEHIFRLLNVFAAHLDLENPEENKFGLDKVIVCCDIENIRTLFASKYGTGVDFSGYIDKFYSREIFYFDNSSIVIQSLNRILASIKIDDKFKLINYISINDGFYSKMLLLILSSFINSNAINLRTLLKFIEVEYSLPTYNMPMGVKNLKNWQIMIFIAFDFLYKVFGTKTNVLAAINKTHFLTEPNVDLGISTSHLRRLVADLSLCTDFMQHSFESDKHVAMIFQEYQISYAVRKSRDGFNEFYFADLLGINSKSTGAPIEMINYKGLLVNAIEVYFEHRGLKK